MYSFFKSKVCHVSYFVQCEPVQTISFAICEMLLCIYVYIYICVCVCVCVNVIDVSLCVSVSFAEAKNF
jgi:hypothetical protein